MVGFNAGPAYDLATGLGSIDAYNLVTKWSSGTAASLSVSADPPTADLSGNVRLTATVGGSGKTAPTGSVTFLVNDTLLGRADVKSATAILNTTGVRIAAGSGTVTALYTGDAIYDPASATVTASGNRAADRSSPSTHATIRT